MSLKSNPDPQCVCSGIRNCAICAPDQVEQERQIEQQSLDTNQVYIYCIKCNRCNLLNGAGKQFLEAFLNQLTSESKACQCQEPTASENNQQLHIDGIYIQNNFIAEQEETDLFTEINESKWIESQSGRFKQDYGPKANFNRKKLKCSTFTGLPFYSKYLIDRLRRVQSLGDFVPVELCNLRYEVKRAACIDPHYDDKWLWGDRLITINLLANTILTLTPGCDEGPVGSEVLLPLARRSVISLSGQARYKWLHAIKKSHVKATRQAVTIRELSAEFKDADRQGKLGQDIERLALTYKGISVGLIEELAIGNQPALKKQSASDCLMTIDELFELNVLDFFDTLKLASLNRKNFSMVKNEPDSTVYSSNFIGGDDERRKLLLTIRRAYEDVDLMRLQTDMIGSEMCLANGLSICLQTDYKDQTHWDEFNDTVILFKIGKRIAEWSTKSSTYFTSNNINKLEDRSYRNILLIKENFECYQKSLVEQLRNSRIDLGLKSKFVSLAYMARSLLDGQKGIVLNDFRPSNLRISNDGLLSNLTSYQNLSYSYVLYDLAMFFGELIVLNGDPIDLKFARHAIDGYKSVNSVIDLKHLYLLILIHLMNRVLECEISHFNEIKLEYVKTFEAFYLKDSDNFL